MCDLDIYNKIGETFVDLSGSQFGVMVGFRAFKPARRMRLLHVYIDQVARVVVRCAWWVSRAQLQTRQRGINVTYRSCDVC